MLKVATRKVLNGHRGYVKCIIGNQTVWTESCGCIRLTKEDALADAEWLKKQHQEANTVLDD